MCVCVWEGGTAEGESVGGVQTHMHSIMLQSRQHKQFPPNLKIGP